MNSCPFCGCLLPEHEALCVVCSRVLDILSEEQFLDWIKQIYKNKFKKSTELTPGQLVDLLFTTDYKCWWSQERLADESLSLEEQLDWSHKAQEYNAKRTKLIRTLDQTLGYFEDTNTGKTYSEKKE